MSHVDYCNAVLVGSLRYINDKLQCILNPESRLVARTKKYNRGLSSLFHDNFHWLNVTQCIRYKLGIMVH